MSNRLRSVLVACLGLLVLLPLGCLGLALQVGPLGLEIGQVETHKNPPPPPRVKKETTLTEEANGTLCQEGEVSVPARDCTSVYYVRPFARTPHLDLSEPDTESVHFLIVDQALDHFTVKNLSLLQGRTFIWRARGASLVRSPLPPMVAPVPTK